MGSSAGQSRQVKVAIVGTGMAGLAAAYCLQRDEGKRYSVTLFEQGERPALDAASVTLRDEHTGRVDRVDLPMRAFAGGYYRNLMAMYDHLGIRYRPQRFLFAFSRRLPGAAEPAARIPGSSSSSGEGGTYFVHSSNNHRIPPVRPPGVSTARWVAETAFLLACYVWLTLAFFLAGPDEDETFGQYLARLRLPAYFVDRYAVPLMSSVATCSHDEMLAFPARDVASYKTRSHGAEHYVVADGVHGVQDVLAKGLEVRLRTRVVKVEPLQPRTRGSSPGGVRLQWQRLDGTDEVGEEEFDRVILAISPDVVGWIFEPLRHTLSKVPTRAVESAVLLPPFASSPRLSVVSGDEKHAMAVKKIDIPRAEADIIALQTGTVGTTTYTETFHTPGSCGAVVRTADPGTWRGGKEWEVLHRYVFQRVLRTPESRRIVNRIMDAGRRTSGAFSDNDDDGDDDKGGATWRNGDHNVWLAGGWCWDGMVLLEGCIVSAARVAHDFGVRVPWEEQEQE